MMAKSLGISVALLLAPLAATGQAQDLETATFAGGCFWCVEADFDKIPGVVGTVPGFIGGTLPNPSYRQVSSGQTGHREAVRITYNPSQVTFEALLRAFWHSIDPTDAGGQFCDRGEPYRTAIFVGSREQRRLAEASKRQVEDALGTRIATSIETAGPFFPAEDYHQDFYKKRPVRYWYYRWTCGRNQRVEDVWGDTAYQGIPGHG